MSLQTIRDVLLLGHRQAFAWVDEWISTFCLFLHWSNSIERFIAVVDCVHLYVHMYAMKWNVTGMKRLYLEVLILANMDVDKISSPSNLHKSSTSWTFIFSVKDSNQEHWKVLTWLSSKQWQLGQTLLLQTQQVRYGLSMGIFIFNLGPF